MFLLLISFFFCVHLYSKYCWGSIWPIVSKMIRIEDNDDTIKMYNKRQELILNFIKDNPNINRDRIALFLEKIECKSIKNYHCSRLKHINSGWTCWKIRKCKVYNLLIFHIFCSDMLGNILDELCTVLSDNCVGDFNWVNSLQLRNHLGV